MIPVASTREHWPQILREMLERQKKDNKLFFLTKLPHFLQFFVELLIGREKKFVRLDIQENTALNRSARGSEKEKKKKKKKERLENCPKHTFHNHSTICTSFFSLEPFRICFFSSFSKRKKTQTGVH
jgi:hypothetical protein